MRPVRLEAAAPRSRVKHSTSEPLRSGIIKMEIKTVICASMQESMILFHTNNKGADQPAHPRSLISAYVIRFLVSMMTTLATHKSMF